MKKLLIYMLLVASPAFAFDGSRLKEYMLANEAVTARKPRADAYGAGVAVGYVTGVADARRGEFWCPRPGVTYGQTMDVVAKYLRDHPERLDSNADDLVVTALHYAFPCPKK